MARIEIENLTKAFGTKVALDGVTLSLEKGQIVGLLGPNGSGKTTMIKILTGLLTPNSGEVRINGMKPGVETKEVVAYLPDRNALPDYMTSEQLIRMYSDFFVDFNKEKAERMLGELGVDMKQEMRRMALMNLRISGKISMSRQVRKAQMRLWRVTWQTRKREA